MREMSASQAASVRVVARIRPNGRGEPGEIPCLNKANNTTIVSKTGESYGFSYVLGPDSSQDESYSIVCGGGLEGFPSFVSEALNGFNTTVIAYGQTGSGKTHTMMGETEDGIIPRLARDLFLGLDSLIQQRNLEDGGVLHVTVKVSFVEIYRERLRDLLNVMSTKPIKIREGDKKVIVENVTEEFVTSHAELLEVMRRGNSARSVAATRMNEDSSRSHSVFTLKIEQVDPEQGTTMESKIQLVDLAGSEQVKRTGAAGDRLEEAKSINLSLSCLGNVVSALVEKRPFVPYRDSKLTRLLQDSLGGTAKTCLIVTLSPSALDEHESISTVRFGQRAQKVQNQVTKNVRRSVDELERLLARAEEELRALRSGVLPTTPGGYLVGSSNSPKANQATIEELNHRIEDLEMVLEKSQSDCNRLEAEKSATEKEKVHLELALSEASLREKRLEADLDLTRKELEEFQTRLKTKFGSSSSSSKVGLVADDVEMFTKRFEDDVSHLTEKCVRYQMLLVEKDEEIDFLKHAKVDEVWIQLRETQQRLKDAEVARDQATSELAIAKMQLQNRQDHIDALQFSHAKVQKNLLQEMDVLEKKLMLTLEENKNYKQVLEGIKNKNRVVVSRPVRAFSSSSSTTQQQQQQASPSTPSTTINNNNSGLLGGDQTTKTPQSMTSLLSLDSSSVKKSNLHKKMNDLSIHSASFQSFVGEEEEDGNQQTTSSKQQVIESPIGRYIVSKQTNQSLEKIRAISPEKKQSLLQQSSFVSATTESPSMEIVPFSLSPDRTDLAKLKRMPEREFFYQGQPRLVVAQRWDDDGKGGTDIGFGAAVYPAAVALGFTLALKRPHTNLEGRRVIELGCGTGLVSLVASAWAGAKFVLATDGDEKTVELCQLNIEKNGLDSNKIQAKKLLWSKEPLDWNELEQDGRPFDIVLASDIVAVPYKEALDALVATLVQLRTRHHEKSGEETKFEILLGYSPRNVSEEAFFMQMREEGFEFRRLGKEEIHPDFAGEQEDCQLFSIV